MEVFSSTLNTAACAGGFKYNPIMSAAFFLKIRIVRGHVAFYAMRLKSVLTPHPCHHHVADLQMRSEFARAPVGCCTRRCMSCGLQNPCFQFRSQHGSDLPQMPAV